MNPFESGARKAVPAVLVYPRCGDELLMIHRNAPGREDYHAGKWNGLGGKCEPDESPVEAARRELLEESGLEFNLAEFRALGVLQFPNFKPQRHEDWIVWVFAVQVPPALRGRRARSPEGDLHWVRAEKVLSLNLWPGDRHFLPYVLDGKPFIGTIWYEKQQAVRHWIEALGAGR